MKMPSEVLNHHSNLTIPGGDTSNRVALVRVDTRRGRIPEDPIHQIPDRELDCVANGSPDSWYLNLAIALLFLPVGLIVSLVTTTMSHSLTLLFTALAAGSFGSGVALCIVWLRQRKSTLALVAKIRARLD